MYIEPEEYYSFLIPASIFFLLGLNLLNYRINMVGIRAAIEGKVRENPRLPYYLISIGFASILLSSFVPASLRFFLYLLTGLRFVGALYLLYSDFKQKWLILWLVFIFAAISSLGTGMFHDLLLWAAFVFLYIAKYKHMTIRTKLLIVIVGLFFAFVIQIAKAEYRKVIWGSSFQGNQTELFTSIVEEQLGSDEDMEGDSQYHSVVIRLNQGWIISRVMYYVPDFENYADGETIKEALSASILPRFLNPTKKGAGGQENFERFTGFMLSSRTSMGTSVIGEAYANYGPNGAAFFMLLYGLVIAFFLRQFLKLSEHNSPTLILWLPIILFQVVKAETELVVVLNHLIKASILVLLIYWISRKIFKIEL